MAKMKTLQTMTEYEEALFRILDTGRIDVAKEIAADALEVDVEEYLEDGEDVFDETAYTIGELILDDN